MYSLERLSSKPLSNVYLPNKRDIDDKTRTTKTSINHSIDHVILSADIRDSFLEEYRLDDCSAINVCDY